MTITIFVEPASLKNFLVTTKMLEQLDMDNDYKFNPYKIKYTESLISNWVWITMEIEEYLKFKYCHQKLS